MWTAAAVVLAVVLVAADCSVPAAAFAPVGTRVTFTASEADKRGLGPLVARVNVSWAGSDAATVTVRRVIVSATGFDVAGCGANSSSPCGSVAFATANTLPSCTRNTPIVVDVVASHTLYVAASLRVFVVRTGRRWRVPCLRVLVADAAAVAAAVAAASMQAASRRRKPT